MANDPISLRQLRNASEDANDLERFVNDNVPAFVPTRLGGAKPNYAKFLAERSADFQEFLLSSGYEDIGDYGPGLGISARNLVFRRDGELYRASASLDLPYVTTGVWAEEADLFVSVGDGALRQQLTDGDSPRHGLGLVAFKKSQRYPVGTSGYQMEGVGLWADRPAMQETRYYITSMRDDSDYSVVFSGADGDCYYHSPRIVRDAGGRYHAVASRSQAGHGFGNSTPANPIDPQGVAVYKFSDDGRRWGPEQVIATALPPDMPDTPRMIFDVHIGICPSGMLVAVATDIPPPSQQWERYTGQAKYRAFRCPTRGELKQDGTTAWEERGTFFEADSDYARIYGERIKALTLPDGTVRMFFTDYRKVSGGGDATVRSFWTFDDDLDSMPIERSKISNLTSSANETDVCFVGPDLGWAIARPNGEAQVTRDGGNSWSPIGNASNYSRQLWETGGLTAPVWDVVWRAGKPYVVMGYSHRGAGPDGPRWLVASVTDMLNLENAVALGQLYTPWGRNNFSGPTVSGPGGYNSGIMFPDGGLVYVDCTEIGASPTTGYTRADVRIVRSNASSWFPDFGGLLLGSNLSRLTQYNDNEMPFVPRLEGATTAGTPAYSSAVGHNVRIGRVAYVQAELIATAYTGITGTLLLRGLPFAPLVVGFNPDSIKVTVVNGLAPGFPATDHIVALLLPSTNQLALYRKSNAGGLVSLTLSDLGAAFNVRISGFYFCANEGLT